MQVPPVPAMPSLLHPPLGFAAPPGATDQPTAEDLGLRVIHLHDLLRLKDTFNPPAPDDVTPGIIGDAVCNIATAASRVAAVPTQFTAADRQDIQTVLANQQVQGQQLQVQGQQLQVHGQLLLQLQGILLRMEAKQHNVSARMHNGESQADSHVLQPLVREETGPNQGQLPLAFPATVGAALALTAVQLDTLGTFYGTQHFAHGQVADRVWSFLKFIRI